MLKLVTLRVIRNNACKLTNVIIFLSEFQSHRRLSAVDFILSNVI
jgi:hypothetical protein